MMDKLRQFWDIPLALIVFFAIMIVPEHNLTEAFQNSLFLIGIMIMMVSLSFEGFHRWSRFALSRNHPVVDYAMNFIIVLTPFLGVFVSPFFVPLVITLHILSHVRSPGGQGVRMSLIHHGLQLTVFLTGFVIYLIQ